MAAESNCEEVNDRKAWNDQIDRSLKELEKELELPDNSLGIQINEKSYSVSICEPDYPDAGNALRRSAIVFNIEEKVTRNGGYLRVIPRLPDILTTIEIPGDAEFCDSKNDKYLKIDPASPNLVSYIIEGMKRAVQNYSPKASSFACCARYEECSEAGKCLHPNKLYAKACAYRKNVEEGRAFLRREL